MDNALPGVLPAEFAGMARLDNGVLDVGGVNVRLPVQWSDVPVYVRRSAVDLSVIEVAIAMHDGLAEEQLEAQNDEAERYPLGPKEYWRSSSVGKTTYGSDQHPMTEDDFEEFWADGEPQ